MTAERNETAAIDRLREAIRDRFGSTSTHLGFEQVKLHGSRVWEGRVELFTIQHHTAKYAYAWFDAASSEPIIVLAGPKVRNAREAVASRSTRELTEPQPA